MSTGDEGMTSPAGQTPVPRRQFVEAVLGSGVFATVVAFLYPVLRYLVPPKELDLGSDAVVAGTDWGTQAKQWESFPLRQPPRTIDPCRQRRLSRDVSDLYSPFLYGPVPR